MEHDPEVTYSSLEGAEAWRGEGNINEFPRFVRNGVFDFTRFVTVEIGDNEVQLPDFIVDPGDYHLNPDSPCVDTAAADDAPVADIEGNERPCGEGVDMGAYEFCAPPDVPFRRGDANADGRLDVADPVFVLSHLFVAGTEVLRLVSASRLGKITGESRGPRSEKMTGRFTG